MPSSRRTSRSRDWTHVSCITGKILYHLSPQGSPRPMKIWRFCAVGWISFILHFDIDLLSAVSAGTYRWRPKRWTAKWLYQIQESSCKLGTLVYRYLLLNPVEMNDWSCKFLNWNSCLPTFLHFQSLYIYMYIYIFLFVHMYIYIYLFIVYVCRYVCRVSWDARPKATTAFSIDPKASAWTWSWKLAF